MALRRTLSHGGFRQLWFGQLASRIGDSIHEIALVWIVYGVTGDPTLLSLTFVASFLPTVVLSLPAGALVDHLNRKWVLVGSDLVRAAAVLAIPLVGEGPLLVPTVLGVAIVAGIADAIDGPARGAFVPGLVPEEDLDAANSLIRTTSSLSQTLFIAGGTVVALFGSFIAFYIDAATFLISAAFVATIPAEHGVPDREDTTRDGTATLRARGRSAIAEMVADIRSILSFVRERPTLRNLLVLQAVLQFALAPMNVAMPVFAPTLAVTGSLALGLLFSAFFTGMTASTLVIGRFDGTVQKTRGILIIAGILGFGVSLVAATLLAKDTVVFTLASLGLFALAGVFFAVTTVPQQTLGQLLVPDERRGRYTAVVGTLSSAAFVVGLALSGPLINLTSARATLTGLGVAVVGIGVVFAFRPLARVHHRAVLKSTPTETSERRRPD
nr:MFS transporter [Halobacterium salinarum]WJK64808.1 MFS transporter [Halobacterium salinarum]